MIARALVSNPEILLLDEPTSALDFKMTKKIMELLLHKTSTELKKYTMTISSYRNPDRWILEITSPDNKRIRTIIPYGEKRIRFEPEEEIKVEQE